MIRADLSVFTVITLFGLFVAAAMTLVRYRHLLNQRKHDDVAHLDDSPH